MLHLPGVIKLIKTCALKHMVVGHGHIKGGEQGGHNLPLPVPHSPASRMFLSLCLPTLALYCVSPVTM